MTDQSILKQLKITDAADLDARFAEIASVSPIEFFEAKLTFFFFFFFFFTQIFF
jgi:hypothetical protein